MKPPKRFQIPVALMLAVSGWHAVWMLWGLCTGGDYFANGSPLLFPTMFLAAAIGFLCGWRAPSRLLILIVVLLFLVSVATWLLLPEGWWVTPPPTPGIQAKR